MLVGMGMGRLVIAALGELVIAATGGLVIAVLGALVITVLGAGHAGCSLWHGGLKKKKRKTYLLGWACSHGYRDWGGVVIDIGTELGGGDCWHC